MTGIRFTLIAIIGFIVIVCIKSNFIFNNENLRARYSSNNDRVSRYRLVKKVNKNRIQNGIALHGWQEKEELDSLVAYLGGIPDMLGIYIQWQKNGNFNEEYFPLDSIKAIISTGAMPVITWEPMFIDNSEENVIPVEDITNGKFDDYIKGFALAMKKLSGNIMVRFAHEMNLKRYHWGLSSEEEFNKEAPKKYIELYKYVVDKVREDNQDNIKFVFCPNAESVPYPSRENKSTWNVSRSYFPGRGYVDILGIDGYDWGNTLFNDITGWQSKHRSFKRIFSDVVSELKKLKRRAPVYVFETSTVRADSGKLRWYRKAIRQARGIKIKGIMWFHHNKERDWALPKNAYSELGLVD